MCLFSGISRLKRGGVLLDPIGHFANGPCKYRSPELKDRMLQHNACFVATVVGSEGELLSPQPPRLTSTCDCTCKGPRRVTFVCFCQHHRYEYTPPPVPCMRVHNGYIASDKAVKSEPLPISILSHLARPTHLFRKTITLLHSNGRVSAGLRGRQERQPPASTLGTS